MTESIRLSKYLADQLSCSRRQAENYVTGGWVRVDGHLVEEPGYRLGPQQTVKLAENACAEDHKPATILLHKPAGHDCSPSFQAVASLITPASQTPDDSSGRHFVKRDLSGLKLVMPLAPFASGLIVFTQEYGIARKLADDAARMEHEYVVEVQGKIAGEGLKRLNHGLSWQGVPLPAIKVSWQNETRLRFALKNPPDGLIQDMCRQVGLNVLGLKRIRVGRVSMAGLPPGQWRYLPIGERF